MDKIEQTKLEKEYGDFQDDTSWYAHAGQEEAGELVYLALGLVGEAGEFADTVKKIIRETGVTNVMNFDAVMQREGVRDRLLDELGDTFWYLNKLLRFLGCPIEKLMVGNTYKLYSRLLARPKADLVAPEWPFSHISLEEVQARQELLKDKESDHV